MAATTLPPPSPKSASTRPIWSQFSVDYDDGTQHTGVPEIATAMQSAAARAKDGCLIYFTSHGTPTGIIVGDAVLTPGPDARHGEQRLRQRGPA